MATKRKVSIVAGRGFFAFVNSISEVIGLRKNYALLKGNLFTGKKITSTVAVSQGSVTESLIFLYLNSFIDKSVFVVNYLSSHLIMKYETTLAATDNKNVVIMVATLLSVAGLGLTTQPFYTHKNYFSIEIFLERFSALCYHNHTS